MAVNSPNQKISLTTKRIDGIAASVNDLYELTNKSIIYLSSNHLINILGVNKINPHKSRILSNAVPTH